MITRNIFRTNQQISINYICARYIGCTNSTCIPLRVVFTIRSVTAWLPEWNWKNWSSWEENVGVGILSLDVVIETAVGLWIFRDGSQGKENKPDATDRNELSWRVTITSRSLTGEWNRERVVMCMPFYSIVSQSGTGSRWQSVAYFAVPLFLHLVRVTHVQATWHRQKA